MKSLFVLAAVVLISFTGCERCATCTTVSDDPQTEGETITQEVCGRGRDYTDQKAIYEGTNWTCIEND